jgi:hypothetical protein
MHASSSTNSSRSICPLAATSAISTAVASDSVVDAGTTRARNDNPVTSTAITRFAPLVIPYGPPRS